ncbi:hypothetical protein VC899_22795 [Citrobacter braakii]|uniref:hypothetical protein n=1 Tax=Citrobacter braakii TaxID=57706 RepID=UPI002B25511E|nr:hypothetical protein [Citrobacter braakii]MEB0967996.1 hypothetical protein [Citrobacter braakii]
MSVIDTFIVKIEISFHYSKRYKKQNLMLSRCAGQRHFQQIILLTRLISSAHTAERHQLAGRSEKRSRKADALFLGGHGPPTKKHQYFYKCPSRVAFVRVSSSVVQRGGGK